MRRLGLLRSLVVAGLPIVMGVAFSNEDAAAQPVTGIVALSNDKPVLVPFPSCGPITVPVQIALPPKAGNVVFGATGLQGLRATFGPPGAFGSLAGNAVITQMTLVWDPAAGALPPGGEQTFTITAGAARRTVNVQRVPIAITSVSPTHVQTPRFGHEGTPITVTGSGFCTNMSVTFGGFPMRNAVASEGGHVLTFNTQAGATDSSVRVANLFEGVATSAPVTVDNFRNTDGFPFANTKPFKDGLGDYDLGDMYEVFHANPIDPFTWAYMAFVDQLMQADCFGFSVTAGRLFENPSRIAGFSGWNGTDPSIRLSTPATDTWHIFGPSLDNGGTHDVPIAKVIRRAQALLASSEVLTAFLAESNFGGDRRNFHDTVMRHVSTGKPAIVGMMSSCLHAVLTYGLRDKPDGSFDVDVYNPNRPFLKGEPSASSTLESSLRVAADGSYVFNDAAGVSCSGSLSDVRILSVDSVPQVGTMITLDPHILLVHLGDAVSVTQVADDAGHTLLNPDGSINSNPATRLPNAARLSGFTGKSQTPIFVMKDGARYAFTVRGKTNGTYNMNHFGPGFGAVLENVPITTNAVDTLLLDPHAGSFEIRSSTAKNIGAKLLVRAPQGTKVATLRTTVAAGGSSIVGFDAARDTVIYKHTGARSKVSFDLAFQTGKTPVVNTQSATLELGSGESLHVTPVWTSLPQGGSIVHKDVNGKPTTHPLK